MKFLPDVTEEIQIQNISTKCYLFFAGRDVLLMS